MSLQDLVNVSVTVTNKTVTQRGFGTALLLGQFSTPAWPTNVLVKEYEDADAMVTEGFPVDHPLVIMAQALKSQDPAPPSFKVGRVQDTTSLAVADHKVKWTPILTAEGTVLSFKVQLMGAATPTLITYTVQTGDVLADITAAVAASVNGVTGLSGTDNATSVEIGTDTPGGVVQVTEWYGKGSAKLEDVTADTTPSYELALAYIKAVDNDWYGLAIDINSTALVTAVATWAEANGKLFGTYATSPDQIDNTYQGLGFARSFGLSKLDKLINGAAAAWLGKMLPTQPGSATWAYKTLAGIAVDENIFPTDGTIKGFGWNVYVRIGGVNITDNGQTFGGTFIDQTVGLDWLVARMQEALFGALVANPKIPYTDGGIDSLRSVALGIMQNGQRVGLLDPSIAPTVTAPKISEISANDRALRKVPGFVARGRLAGAIHTLTMNIELSI